MVAVSSCPVCGNTDLKNLLHCIDYTVSHETFDIRQCTNCLLAITTPRPEDEKLAHYYVSDEYISHSGKSSGGIGFLYGLARTFSLNWKKKIIHKFSPKGKLLDFGCGTGEFLHTLKKDGWQVSGVEPSEVANKKAQTLLNEKIHTSLQEIEGQKYDVITAWHVLEHVPQLKNTLELLKQMLQKDGTIFIAVPNYESPDAMQYKEHWAGYDVPRHLWHFSRQSMKSVLGSVDLNIVSVIPMKLDAYYVSLLSEIYKKDNQLTVGGMIQAFISGTKSNLKASKYKNYSSLIYVAKNL
jgi:2-polyprenyl-3-methyl-5-hydroxy-6-metoxy-1,4-benzoquinol methylase